MEHYNLPKLLYGYKDLEPVISEEVLTLHHTKHHASYVNGANAILDKLDEARRNNAEIDFKAISKSLSFNVGGHVLHELFWKNMAPHSAEASRGKPAGKLAEVITKEFGSFERFKKEFSETAKSVEGSGWAALTYQRNHGKNGMLSIVQIEKHNVNLYPEQEIILVLDVWEHAYYLDYKNDRGKFIENWWSIVNWDEAEKRFSK